MSYTLIISEVRRGQFEERNLDSIGLGVLLEKDSVLLIPKVITLSMKNLFTQY